MLPQFFEYIRIRYISNFRRCDKSDQITCIHICEKFFFAWYKKIGPIYQMIMNGLGSLSVSYRTSDYENINIQPFGWNCLEPL